MTKLNLNKNELAERWGVSPKTLQRWRTERRGPSYLKLSKRVTYPLEDILAFESNQKMVMETSRRTAIKMGAASSLAQGQDPNVPGVPETVLVAQNDATFMTASQVIYATRLPRYYFVNAELRERLEIPHYLLGRRVRFKLDEIRQWEREKLHHPTMPSIDPIAAIFQQLQSTSNEPDNEVDGLQRRDQVFATDQQRSTLNAPAANGEPLSAPDQPKMTLPEALRQLHNGTLLR